MTIVEFTAHTAYLDPLTGIGHLLTPCPGTDIGALWTLWSTLPGPRGCTIWNGRCTCRCTAPIACMRSLSSGSQAVRRVGLPVEIASSTADGRQAPCVYGEPTAENPTLEVLDCATVALDIAADLAFDARPD